MSRSENTALLKAKKQANHLHSILAKRFPDVSLGECYNLLARISGFRDWNTQRAAFLSPADVASAQHPTEAVLETVVLPPMQEIAQNLSMQMTVRPWHDDCEDKAIGKHIELTLLNVPDCSCEFILKMTDRALMLVDGQLQFGLPESHMPIAISLLKFDFWTDDQMPALRRIDGRLAPTYRVEITVDEIFAWADKGKTFVNDADMLSDFQGSMLREFQHISACMVAFGIASRDWTNRSSMRTFEKALHVLVRGEEEAGARSVEFYRQTFGTVVLRGILTKEGPVIEGPGGSVPYGVASIIYHDQDDKDGLRGYHIAKYGHQSELRVDLHELSADEITRLSQHTGIPIMEEDRLTEDGNIAFYRSPAFEALRATVKKHPRRCKKAVETAHYLSDWYERALDKVQFDHRSPSEAPERQATSMRGQFMEIQPGSAIAIPGHPASEKGA